jgi:RimJ/RimL family protein N-acetyltransferase
MIENKLCKHNQNILQSEDNAMNHKGTVTLETERLILRKFTIEDAEAMFRNFYSDPEAVRYSRWQPHQSVETTQELISQYTAEYENTDCYNWVIVLRDADEPIGRISVSHLDECEHR